MNIDGIWSTAGNAWLLVSAALVLFMTPGLALFYGGLDRGRNLANMMMMNFWCLLVVPVLWVVLGFSLAQVPFDAGWIGGFDHAFLRGLGVTGEDGGFAVMVVAFLGMFAVITPALISGAVAGRMRFRAWAVFVPVWVLLVYVPVFKWIYGGWLGSRGSLDFAGGTAIHVNAGIAALACVLVLGRRRAFPDRVPAPHSLPLVMIGAGILWFGWFGFNAGSAPAALASMGTAIQAFMNTFLAAASGGLAWLAVEVLRGRKATNVAVASGIVAGLVAVTPGAGYVTGMSAVAIGLVAGAVCPLAVGLKARLGYDDALDVVGVHFVAGLLGSLLVGVFADPGYFGASHKAGLLAGGGASLLLEQLLANGAVIAYSFVVTALVMLALKATVGVRADEGSEDAGLDATEHGEHAYVAD